MDRNTEIREKGIVSARSSSTDFWNKLCMNAGRIKFSSMRVNHAESTGTSIRFVCLANFEGI